ncbi:MAG: HAD-IIIA family hydrolase [Roseivirga sp.]|uniref:KdsC family phosphatase n=1 Tax=Roseivirga sp. TaxID=1964215 RepID=UPI001B14D32E|nr:HAD-IIIA family hydrolase [Roseivirga sp.]MBO6495160.1 HAD-IIIA family hydrolase [Roseivirga sp.]MBO6660509.1 HAD-IIIA family hydrolase [Roseivirga sp.]MBO6760087.1 HAD-IIIA family hydrolase [Roseivirga sp.]MBO6906754.1 HAD-IIIA family hydrolase [Roseivirga sp.]
MSYSEKTIEQARKIKAIVFDVDGVLTDGGIVYDNAGMEFKRFNVKDGQIIKYLKRAEVYTAVITGRDSLVVRNRCEELKIDKHYHGIKNKLETYQKLKEKWQLTDEQIAYVGDDINDLPVLVRCGLSCTPSDGHYKVKEHVDLVLKSKGGEGVLRELADLVLEAQNRYEDIIKELI